jgi:L,D-peptidoglycan transpeptidase YkuD (ErfK/YbiS/YcfS/YnhG family)
MKRTTVPVVRVYRSALDPSRGRLVAGAISLPCALGRGGVRRGKREGDGGSPVGRLAVLGGLYRADRLRRPRTLLRLRPIRPDDGWCDDPRDRRYNRPVRRPYPASHEALWRDDHLYDVVLDLAWNRGPIVPGRGSAIFLHVATSDFAPTAGCVAIQPSAVQRLLERIGPNTVIEIVG